MISATSRMSSTVNDTLDHGAVSCVTAPSPSPEFRTPEPYILMLVRTRRTCHPERAALVSRGIWASRALGSLPICSSSLRSRPFWLAHILAHFLHRSLNLPPRHPHPDLSTRPHLLRVLHQAPLAIKDQRVPPLQNRQWGKHLQRPAHALCAHSILQQQIAHPRTQCRRLRGQLSTHSRQHAPRIVMPHRRRDPFPT